MFNRIFNFNDREMRTVFNDGQIWFVAKDVCDVLEIVNSRDAIAGLENDERGVANTDTLGGSQEMVCVNESGLYHLIFKSRKKVAREFRKWVTGEVLPSIRKYGSYWSGSVTAEEMRAFIERFFPAAEYGAVSDKTRLLRLIAVKPHFRSCRIARVNLTVEQPDFFQEEIDQG